MITARFLTTLLLILSLGVSSYAQDDAEAADSAEAAAPEKVDMQDLEKKYWAPSDQGYTVVQDRTYTKAGRFGVSLLAGPVIMYDWYDGFNFGLAGSYHFNERWGIEAQFQMFSLDANDAVVQIDNLAGAINRGEIKNYFGVTGRWVPFYSKMSFMGQSIIYFDMSLGASIGMIQYTQEQCMKSGGICVSPVKPGGGDDMTTVAIGFDVSQTYYITPSLALRVDYAMKFFNEEIVNFNPAFPGEEEDKMSSYTTFNLGLTYLF